MDHFALPNDPLAVAKRQGRLHRNFQGFTDDGAPVLLGLGASAISMFPHVIVQNEKNPGRYRMLLSQDRLPATRGVRRSACDRRRGDIIEHLLCHGHAPVGDGFADDIARLAPFAARGLVTLAGGECRIEPEGLPYSRAIAAQFDPYRAHSPRRFSSAV